MGDSLLGKKSLVVITGASAGIGRQMCLDISKEVGNGSRLILVARRAGLLEEVKAEIKDEARDVSASVLPFDLGKFPEHKEDFSARVKALSSGMESVILIHNAAWLGNIKDAAKNLGDEGEILEYMKINLTSFILLNNAFLAAVGEIVKEKLIVNVTSIAARKGFPSFSLYCTGKAAREGFIRVLTVEEPEIRILNYSPGAVETDMVDSVKDSGDPRMRAFLTEFREQGKLLTPAFTVKAFIRILNRNTFTNGAHVDVHDVKDNGDVEEDAKHGDDPNAYPQA